MACWSPGNGFRRSSVLHAAVSVAIIAAMAASSPWLVAQDMGVDRAGEGTAEPPIDSVAAARLSKFQQHVRPFLLDHCVSCHNVDDMTSGVRVDHLDGTLLDRHLRLWEHMRDLIEQGKMPPEDEPQPAADERRPVIEWINNTLTEARVRPAQKNGTARRMTVAQFRNTLHDLLGLEDQLTGILPPDSISRDGFANNSNTLELSPLMVETYFEIAEQALDRCIVDEQHPPAIQNFRMDLGRAINPAPCPDQLILGANSLLLANEDFVVTQLTPEKPFAFTPFFMKTKFRFIEGYQGNDTVRGWRDYDSIYHAVFACMRGTDGYPKGLPFQALNNGLALRPAIPSTELFGQSSTYGPQANFKISLRELPDSGRFRITVQAAKYDDGLLLEPGHLPNALSNDTQQSNTEELACVVVTNPGKPQSVEIPRAGIYRVDVCLNGSAPVVNTPDSSNLNHDLIGEWTLDGDATGRNTTQQLVGRLTDGARFSDSPFGQALSVDGISGALVSPRDPVMNVGDGDFTVAAWIRPEELRQGGIVCLGRYSYTHGWYFDMPNDQGVLRIETMNPDNQPNGTVQSRPGVIRRNQWQHVAAIVRRGENQTHLYVNGFKVATGTVQPTNLDNLSTSLHIGRIESGNLFKGRIDNVHIYRRALSPAELSALIEPGRRFADAPPAEQGKKLSLTLGDRNFTAALQHAAFVAVRLPTGPLQVEAKYDGDVSLEQLILTQLDADDRSDPVAGRFMQFERQQPRLGVHLGLRRDCGSTLSRVGRVQNVSTTEFETYVFEGAIRNFPSPDVEKDNVNYLAGVREIGVRSEYTDGRDMPRLLIRSVEFEGPLYDTWPPPSHRAIFIESENQHDRPAYAREIIRSFGSRAMRRPVTVDEEEWLFSVWRDSFAATGDFRESIRDTALVILTSPQFLFLIENSSTPAAEPLAPYELAARLSYLLWNTAPDQRLLDLAAAGTLHDEISAESKRLIDDPRFGQFTTEFVSQWLALDALDVVEVDRSRFPKLSRDVKSELRREPVEFIQHLLRHNLSLKQLIRSETLVVNEVVADYYGLGAGTDSGFEFVAIRHNDEHLGGILTQAAVLAGQSNGREPNPVKRGAWLARKIIAQPPDDPPPNVPALPEQGGEHLSLREKLEQHRNQPGCAKCHAGIDPWGVPFEQYDAAGLFRMTERGNTQSILPDATAIDDVDALRDYLLNKRLDQVAFSFLKHLAAYAAGRDLHYNEVEFLRQAAVEWPDDEYRMQDLLHFVIASPIFLEK